MMRVRPFWLHVRESKDNSPRGKFSERINLEFQTGSPQTRHICLKELQFWKCWLVLCYFTSFVVLNEDWGSKTLTWVASALFKSHKRGKEIEKYRCFKCLFPIQLMALMNIRLPRQTRSQLLTVGMWINTLKHCGMMW